MIIEKYKERALKIKNYSYVTVHTYLYRLKSFEKYLQSIDKTLDDISEIGWDDIEQYVIYLRSKWISPNTCNAYLLTLIHLLKFCSSHNIHALDPKQITLWKQEAVKIEACTEKEIRTMIKLIKNRKYKNPIIKYRDLAIVYTLLWTWLRVSELQNLKVSDIKETLEIKWKWGKIRTIPFPLSYRKYINSYIKKRKSNCEYVFLSHTNNYESTKLSTVWIQLIVRDLWSKAEISTYPHKMRHTYATMLLKRGVSIYHIQRLLWHSSLKTTERYLTCYDIDLERAVSKLPTL